MDPEKISSAQRKMLLEERKRELLKARQRRQERDLERAQWEEERATLDRERDKMDFKDWEKQENEFHLRTARLRSEIRLKEGRARPIDYVARNLTLDDDEATDEKDQKGAPQSTLYWTAGSVSIQPPQAGDEGFDEMLLDEPEHMFADMPMEEMLQTQTEIQAYLELDKPRNKEFWQAMLVVCEDAIAQARIRQGEPIQAPAAPGTEAESTEVPVNDAVLEDARLLMRGKSTGQLNTLEAEIKETLRVGGPGVDVEYWEAMAKQLILFRAKAILHERHARILERRLKALEQKMSAREMEQLRARQQQFEKRFAEPTDATPEAPAATSDATATATETATATATATATTPEGAPAAGEAGGAAPGDVEEVPVPGVADLTEEQRKALALQASAPRTTPAGDLVHEAMLQQMEEFQEGDQESNFNDVVALNKVYHWTDKFRPRKPKYYNRVRTGYEWNKYNQTHYDHDNPPPKVVMGYKFNIFYPDLIDKTQAPRYFVEDCPGNDLYKIIRFHAGPPYEDVAFKVVNKEWEMVPKKGFRCVFENGILHVFFNFRRYRYRR
eukprot:GAFH01001080.1.p1 GENE.GAFH01001080.1~~GAFH01001080.1.p1  ORF type:complete len:635 (-),score=217.56 GAFH01001080.1:104-1771(-)